MGCMRCMIECTWKVYQMYLWIQLQISTVGNLSVNHFTCPLKYSCVWILIHYPHACMCVHNIVTVQGGLLNTLHEKLNLLTVGCAAVVSAAIVQNLPNYLDQTGSTRFVKHFLLSVVYILVLLTIEPIPC